MVFLLEIAFRHRLEPLSISTAQHINPSDDNDDGDEDNGEEPGQVRYNGGYFDNFFAAYDAAFSAEDPYPYLRSLDDLDLPGLR